jgi:hypothetical protein
MAGTHSEKALKIKRHVPRNRNGIARMNRTAAIVTILLCFIGGTIAIDAQPSGGPYGPIQQTWELPEVTGKIYYVAPAGNPKSTGKKADQPTTIERAIEKVNTGDAIILRGGVYRSGNLILNQGVTIQPYQNEQPVFKGTFVADQWQNLGNGLWVTSWTNLFPSQPANWWRRYSEGRRTPLHKFNNDMVFSDGKFMQAVGWQGDVNENTYFIDYDNQEVYIGTDPTSRLIEITAFNIALRRTKGECHGKSSDGKGPIIRGVTFTQYAYCALEIEGTDPEGVSAEADHGKEVIGSILEHCSISYCGRVAAYLRGDSLTIRHCKISDTSTEGIYLIASNDALLEKNIFTRNNIERITGYYPAAVKIFNQCYRVTCRDNLVIDLPYSNGIWYDVGNVDGVFINNWVEGVGRLDVPLSTSRPWPSDNGFFLEISKGVICAGNVFVNCDHGLWILNSSDAQIYQNTFINSTACIGRTARSAANDHFGWHPATGPDVDERDGHIFMNNLMFGDDNFDRPLLFVWQYPSICDRLPKPQLTRLDHNIYVRFAEPGDKTLIVWGPAKNETCQIFLKTLEELRNLHPEFSANSHYFSNYHGPLFKGSEIGNYEVMPSFPGADKASPLPDHIQKLLGESGQHVGALPLVP